MKNLNQNYNKILLQNINLYFYIKTNKIKRINLWQNLLGFQQEYPDLHDKEYKNNFGNCLHHAYGDNDKLWRKYPSHVKIKDHKNWLKRNYFGKYK